MLVVETVPPSEVSASALAGCVRGVRDAPTPLGPGEWQTAAEAVLGQRDRDPEVQGRARGPSGVPWKQTFSKKRAPKAEGADPACPVPPAAPRDSAAAASQHNTTLTCARGPQCCTPYTLTYWGTNKKDWNPTTIYTNVTSVVELLKVHVSNSTQRGISPPLYDSLDLQGLISGRPSYVHGTLLSQLKKNFFYC